MEQFSRFCELIGAGLPDLLSLLLFPALLVVAGLLLAVFRKEKAYLPLAVGLGGAGTFLAACEAKDALQAIAYLALFAACAALVKLIFLIPFRTKGGAQSHADDLYRKFALPLEVQEEEELSEEGEEDGLRLGHATELLEALEKCDLSASDRLEADALAHTLDAYRGRALTAEETRSLNDCLASILKLTAKYKL